MKITIGFELESGVDDAEMITWLNAVLAGEDPVKARKPRKPRKEMTDEEKAVFRARMVKGQEAATKAKAKADKKPASKKKKK